VLSQLSYSPIWVLCQLVGLGRFELPTSPLSGVRSNQLSYRPVGPSPAGLITTSQEPGGSSQITVLLKGFGNKVEHAGQLRHP
jgi:hypothetical protein